jgi:hypothetical protein
MTDYSSRNVPRNNSGKDDESRRGEDPWVSFEGRRSEDAEPASASDFGDEGLLAADQTEDLRHLQEIAERRGLLPPRWTTRRQPEQLSTLVDDLLKQLTVARGEVVAGLRSEPKSAEVHLVMAAQVIDAASSVGAVLKESTREASTVAEES